MCFINVQSSLNRNVVSSVCARMGNATYIMFIMWNSISGLEAWFHFQFVISRGVAVFCLEVINKNFREFFKGMGGEKLGGGQFVKAVFYF